MPPTVPPPHQSHPLPGRAATHDRFQELANTVGCEPFTTATMADLGITRGQLRALHRRGYVTRLNRGLYALNGEHSDVPPSAPTRARAALAPLGDRSAVITGPLAGALHGLPFVHAPTSLPIRDSVEILVLESDGRRCGYRECDAVVRRVRQFPPDVEVIDGIPVTSVMHAAIDIVRMGFRTPLRSRAKALFVPESLVVLDAATARLGATTPEEALELVMRLRPRFRYGRGIRTVDAIVELIDPRSESPMESWSRGYMIIFAVPEPILQYEVVGANGIAYRVDFCWPEYRVIGEADGLAKYGQTPAEVIEAKNREMRRQRALEDAGWTVIRWTWQELATDPKAVMARLNQTLRTARRAAGPPPRTGHTRLSYLNGR
jgi:hypothetical protein